MLEILALAREDGWAFVRDGRRIRLLRPPYTGSSSADVSEATVATATARHGFVAPGPDRQRFADWPALVGFLKSEVVAARKARGLAAPADEVGEQLLEYAPEATFRSFLDRIDRELLPAKAWDHAEKLLLRMLALPAFRENDDLCARAVALLERTSQGRKQAQADWGDLTAAADEALVVCLRASRRYGPDWIERHAVAIQQRGTVFSFVD
jgi:hypothetical protein